MQVEGGGERVGEQGSGGSRRRADHQQLAQDQLEHLARAPADAAQLFLKLFGATRLGPQALTRLVEAQRRTYLAELGGLTRLRREHSADPMVALLIDAAVAHTKADLEIVDSAESRLAEVAAAGGVNHEDRCASTDTQGIRAREASTRRP